MRLLLVSSFLIATMFMPSPVGPAFAAEPDLSASDATTTVFYFHGERRCATCRSIESAAHDVVHDGFADRLEAGDLAWRVINFDRKENRHYIKDLGLAGSGVVVARVAPDGEIRSPKVLQEVWRHGRDEKRMRQYLTEQIALYLDESP